MATGAGDIHDWISGIGKPVDPKLETIRCCPRLIGLECPEEVTQLRQAADNPQNLTILCDNISETLVASSFRRLVVAGVLCLGLLATPAFARLARSQLHGIAVSGNLVFCCPAVIWPYWSPAVTRVMSFE